MTTPTPKRLQITPRLLLWLGLDGLGVLLFAAGALFLFNGTVLFVKLPESMVEAAFLLVSGGILMLIAGVNLLKVFLPEATAKSENDVLGE